MTSILDRQLRISVGGIMHSTRLVAAMAATSMLLVGCATNVNESELPFDRSQSGNIRVIGLVDPGVPTRASSPIPSAGGGGGGLIGLVVVAMVEGTKAVMRGNREDSLDQIAKKNNFNFKDHFADSIKTALLQQSYDVKMVELPREKGQLVNKGIFTSKNDSQIDAYLDISVLDYGYIAASPSDDAPYRPYVVAKVQLVSADGKDTVLMKDDVIYNPYSNPKNVVSIPPDPQYNFVHFSDIEANPEHAISGMNEAASQTGFAIAKLLK